MNNLLKNIYWLIGNIIKDIFKIFLITLIVFFVLESFEPGLISNHLDFNWLIVFCLIFGIIVALWPSGEMETKKIHGAYFWGFIFGLMIIPLIGWQTYNLGQLGYFFPLLAGLIVVLIFGAMKKD